MIHPDHHGRGLFRLLARYAAGEAAEHRPVAMLVMANPAGARAHCRGLGWSVIKIYHDYVAASRRFQSTELEGFHFHQMCNGDDDSRPMIGAVQRRVVPRSERHLRWRFRQHPWYRYEAYLATKRGAPWGYLVLKTFRNPQTSELFGDIVDVGWMEEDRAGLRCLLEFALDHFWRQGVPTVATWLQTGTTFDEVAGDLGFAATSRERHFCGLALGESGKGIVAGGWMTTMADAEIY
jgi:hypothetical protein